MNMPNQDIFNTACEKFKQCYGRSPAVVAYAPGRVEVLGNHTDYNEGLVLSAAIDYGTFFAVAPAAGTNCRLTAGDLMQEVQFEVRSPQPVTSNTWANYSLGVLAGLLPRGDIQQGFEALFFGNIPLGSGLSSSAALEISTGMALAQLYRIPYDLISLARIAQQAEHNFAGVKCGLLDQISSLYGREEMLVLTDFRSLEIKHAPLGTEAALLICNTHAKHALVDGEYNQRRADCETAVAYFQKHLSQPVTALRDVSWADWETHRHGLEDRVARRAAHPIGEIERVARGAQFLAHSDIVSFGQLMFESHRSSQSYFENSCEELDYLVDTARRVPGILGARLSGGGFGGSVAVLVRTKAIETASELLAKSYADRYGQACDINVIHPSVGARIAWRANETR